MGLPKSMVDSPWKLQIITMDYRSTMVHGLTINHQALLITPRINAIIAITNKTWIKPPAE